MRLRVPRWYGAAELSLTIGRSHQIRQDGRLPGSFRRLRWRPCLSVAKDNCSGQWVQIGTTIVVLNNDPSVPQHMAVGTCDETGRCTYKDKDGDGWTDQSAYPVGTAKGTWKTVSGTGTYVDSTKNSGWTHIRRTELGGADGTVYIGAFGGTCKVN